MTTTLELFPYNFFHTKKYYLHKFTEWNVDLILNLFLNIESFVVYGKWNWIFYGFSFIFIALLWEKKVTLITNYAPIHHKYCFYFMNIWCISGLLISVPSQPPQGVQATAINSRSIKVVWSPPPLFTLHGILQGYKIYYKPVRFDEGNCQSVYWRPHGNSGVSVKIA